MALNANYASTPRMWDVQVSTANTARDGTGTLGTLIAADTVARRIEEIVITASVTTTAGMIRLFLFNGTNVRLFREIPVTAITVGASTPAFTATLLFQNLVLEANDELRVGTHAAEAINVFAFGGTF
jgi:hypothetical protein